MRKIAPSPTPDAIPLDFTRIELMSALPSVAILSSVARPAFMGQTRSARRRKAVDALSREQQAQERWRTGNAQYASPISLGIPSTAASGNFSLNLSAACGTAAGTGGENYTHDTRVIDQFQRQAWPSGNPSPPCTHQSSGARAP